MTEALAYLGLAWLAWALLCLAVMGLASLAPSQHAHHDALRGVRMPSHVRLALDREELAALMEHELGHARHRHAWRNLARLALTFRPASAERRLAQELEADDCAQDPAALARALRKLSSHPVDLARAARLDRISRESGDPAARDARLTTH